MKIGIDIRTLMDSQYSGVSEYTLNLVKEILKLDSKNDYKLFYNSLKDISDRIPNFNFSNAKIVKKSYPNKLLNYCFLKYFNFPKIDKLLDVDIFFSPHINFTAFSTKSKNILTIHDLSFLRFPEFFSFRKNFWHKMINVRKLVKKYDKIIAVSENTKNDIIELCGVDPQKIKVVYSGIEEEFTVINGEDEKIKKVKDKYGLSDNFMLYLGTVEPRKNIEGVIGAYNKYRDNNDSKIQLVIAGGKGWKSEKIYKKWKESRYKDDINFLGYVDKKDKVYLYNLASIFIYPSFYEGFGFPPLEAMACGTPVITSFTSSLPEIIGSAGVMVDPHNITDIASAIENIINDKELRSCLVEKGLEKTREFRWEKTAIEYINIFKELDLQNE